MFDVLWLRTYPGSYHNFGYIFGTDGQLHFV